MREGKLRPRMGCSAVTMAIAAAIALAIPATSGAAMGGAPMPGANPTQSGSASGAPAPEPSAGAISLLEASTTPRRAFYFGYRYPRLHFSIASNQPENDLRIDVVDAAGQTVRTFYRNDVPPETPRNIRWDGTDAAGKTVRNGRYSFRVSAQEAAAPPARKARASTTLALDFTFYGYEFPILGPHEFGMGAGRFGAARSGHTHQGQDVMAACGTPLVAARGGRVQYAGFQYAAGNYLVIDGRGTPDDFMYAHLAEPSPLQTGDVVRTGQPIGIVGETGDATACHLHFEMWGPPGWYEGGSPFDPLPYLERWDTYS